MKHYIYNEDCLATMKRLGEGTFDVILTSPPYNTNAKAGGSGTLGTCCVNSAKLNVVRYDSYVDTKTNDEYCAWCVDIFKSFDRVLKKNGVVLWQVSYGAENTECMFRAVNAIMDGTPFTVADTIVWKKPCALPNNMSPNRLTRYCEFVMVFCRRSEMMTFRMNKAVTSIRKTGQANFENVSNVIEAPNNDGPCELNKATYSTELCLKLLDLYAVGKNAVVYDPFLGTGTTMNACKEKGFVCHGSEISRAQCDYAKWRIDDMFNEAEIMR